MVGEPVCLDYAASTPMRPEAVAAMVECWAAGGGNPTGQHALARRAKTALEEAREVVAEVLGCAPGEVVFTGGGTEADNLAVIGSARAMRRGGLGGSVVTTAFEHKAVLAACDALDAEGFLTTRVGVTRGGIVDLDELAAALDDRTVVVSVLLVNNEVGTIQPLADVATLVRERSPYAVLHTDAVQGAPWLDVAVAAADADLVAISGHKFGGPAGVGVLVVRGAAIGLDPLLVGGGQERGLRAGTPNVAGAVGLAAALRVTAEHRTAENSRIAALRDRLAAGLAAAVPGMFTNGDAARKVPGNLHVGFPGVEFDTLLVALDQAGVCAAAGSSCSSGATTPSYVLTAMGVDADAANCSIRLSLGYPSTDLDVDRALVIIPEVVDRLRRAGAHVAAARS